MIDTITPLEISIIASLFILHCAEILIRKLTFQHRATQRARRASHEAASSEINKVCEKYQSDNLQFSILTFRHVRAFCYKR